MQALDSNRSSLSPAFYWLHLFACSQVPSSCSFICLHWQNRGSSSKCFIKLLEEWNETVYIKCQQLPFIEHLLYAVGSAEGFRHVALLQLHNNFVRWRCLAYDWLPEKQSVSGSCHYMVIALQWHSVGSVVLGDWWAPTRNGAGCAFPRAASAWSGQGWTGWGGPHRHRAKGFFSVGSSYWVFSSLSPYTISVPMRSPPASIDRQEGKKNFSEN